MTSPNIKSTGAFLADLRAKKIKLWVDGEDLCFDAPKGALTAAIGAELRRRKPALIAFLKRAGQISQSAKGIPRAPRKGPLPLSFAQQQLWLMDQMNQGSAYNVPTAVALNGPFSVPALQKALDSLIRRHEILRTVYRQDGEVVVQEILPPRPASLTHRILDGADPKQKAVLRDQAIEEAAYTGFDLSSELPVKVTVLQLEPEKHVLLLVLHHIVTDGWTMGLLVQELSVLYEAAVKGKPPALKPLPIQYADYAVWQRAYLEGDRCQNDLQYWVDHLAGIPRELDLPLDHARGEGMDFEGASHKIQLPEATVARLKALCRSLAVTSFTPLLANLYLTLARWCGQDDIVIGTVVAGRSQKETENLIGCFMNFLALRARVRSDHTVRQFLDQVKTCVAEGYAHEAFPFEKVVEAAAPGRGAGQNPIYNVAFLLQSFPEASSFGSEVDAQPLSLQKEKAYMDLRFIATESGHSLSLTCEYRSALFESETIEQLLIGFVRMLDQALTSQSMPVADLTLNQALIDQAQEARRKHVKKHLAVAATFTAEPVTDDLNFWIHELNLGYEPVFAPYNQVFQELLVPDSLLSQNQDGANLLLVRFEDWERMGAGMLPSVSKDRVNQVLADQPRHRMPNHLEVAHLNRYETEYLYQEIFVDRVYMKQGVVLEEGAVIFDVGANIGLCTLFMSQNVKNAQIFAFEPAPHAYDRLSRNISLYCPGATAFNYGLADIDGDARFTFYPLSSVFSSYFADEEEDEKAIRAIVRNMLESTTDQVDEAELERFTDDLMADRLKKETVDGKLRSVSSVIREHGVTRIDLLKVDVEKSELPVLRGIEPEHWPLIRQVIIEVHDQEGPVIKEVMDILRSHNFHIDDFVEEALLSGSGLYNVYASREPGKRRVKTLDEQVQDFQAALEAAAARSASPHLVMICPPSPAILADQTRLDGQKQAVAHLKQASQKISGLTVYDWEDAAAHYPAENIHDLHGDQIGRVPYTAEGFSVLAAQSIRTLGALTRKPYKVIMLDCDNTLWGGVCGEVGPEGISLSPAFLGLQTFMKEQRNAGLLLCLVSKNSEDDVFQVFDQRGDMVLTREDLVAWKVNWLPKSVNIIQLATELGLGVDSFIFVDDNPVEIAEVSAHCPGVLTLQLPKEEADIAPFLNHVWAFDHLTVTAEDHRRTDMYRENLERESVRTAMTFTDFIASLGLEVSIAPMTPQSLTRSAQMTMRTNQFNFTTVRRSEGQLLQDCEQGDYACFTAHVSDRFGDYGQVGLAVVKAKADHLDVDSFMLSCRALGRGVEHRLLAFVGEYAQAQNLKTVSLTYLPTERNQPALNFLQATLDAYKKPLPNGGFSYHVPTDDLAAVVFKPQEREQAVAPSKKARKSKKNQEPLPFQRIAEHFRSLEAIGREVDRFRRRENDAATGSGVPPRNPTEEVICATWADVLGLERVGVHDAFFEIGGHSLQATRVISRLRVSLGVELSLQDIFNMPTAAKLGAYIQNARRAVAGPPAVEPGERRLDQTVTHPVSFSQQRLWFVDRLMGSSNTYNMPYALRLKGALNQRALERAFSELIARQDGLRTTFAVEDGQPVQIIHAYENQSLPVTDLRGLKPSDRDIETTRLAARSTHYRFDLEKGPLFRYGLLLLDQDYYALLLNMHHIISDGWSLGVMVRELMILYRAACAGETAPLEPLPVQYADYARWQQQWMTGENLARELDYWKEHLKDAPHLLDLPTDRPRPGVPSYRGNGVEFRLNPDLTTALNQLCRTRGVTMFMVLETAFAALLSRYSGQDQVVLGSSFANRDDSDLEHLIGFFVNTHALVNDFRDTPSFSQCLDRTRQVTMDAWSHQSLPFDQVVEALEPDRDLSHTPIFQVMFVLQNTPFQGSERSELAVEPLGDVTHFPAQYDITLTMSESPAGLFGFMVYSTDLFEKHTISRMVSHFETLLEGAAANPNQPIAQLPLMTGAERLQTLKTWNNTQSAFQPTPVHQQFQRATETAPENIALEWDGGSITYGQLNRRANQAAHWLRNRGVGPDQIVAFSMRRSPEAIIAILAIHKAGAAYAPIDPKYPLDRLREMVDDMNVRFILTGTAWAGNWKDASVETLCLDLDGGDWDQLETLPETNPRVPYHPHNLAYVIYTSGSTGKPKGVMISHGSLINQIHWRQTAFHLDADDRVLLVISLNFDPSVWHIFWALCGGARLYLPPQGVEKDVAGLAQLMLDRRITVTAMVPSLLRVLMDQSAFHQCHGLKHISCGGEAIQEHLQQRFLDIFQMDNVLNVVYGPTEATIDAAYWPLNRQTAGFHAPLGAPISNAQVYVLNGSGQPCTIRMEGELFLAGLNLGRGYLNEPAATALKYLPNPFSEEPGQRLYRTGDLARWRSTGNLEFMGRVDRQVKVRGFRIELGEIETRLNQHSLVTQSLVMVREDTPGNQRITAYATGSWLEPAQLRDFLAEKLPEHMLPSAFIHMKAMPLTENGKIDVRALPSPAADDALIQFVEPATPVEEMMAAIWADILEVEKVSAVAGFFELGGHSLLATRVISRIREVFKVEMPLRSLFEAPTVQRLSQQLTRHLSGADDGAVGSINPYDGMDPAPLSFAQQRLWFLDRLEPGSAYNMPTALLLEGTLNEEALEQAVNLIQQRHQILRSRFPEQGGRPVQIINPENTALEIQDLQHLSAEEAMAETRNMATANAAWSFNLAQGPLIRMTLVKLAPDRHAFLICMHHIIADGWSVGVMVRELAAFYSDLAGGQAPQAPALPIQYSDYARWQRDNEHLMETHRDYWKTALEDAPDLLNLPTDRSRPQIQRFFGDTHNFRTDHALADKLNELSRTQGATLFMTLQTAFAALLSRYSDQRDLVVGSPVANRNRAETEPLIGLFINTLAMRHNLQDDPSFITLLGRTRQTSLDAFLHQDIPFEQVVELVSPERNLAHSPVFQVMFILQNAPMGALELPGLRLSHLDADPMTTARFDLTLSMRETETGLIGAMEYNTDLFNASTMARMANHFTRLLEAAVASPDLPVSRLSLLTSDEANRLLHQFNQTESGYNYKVCLHTLFEEQARETPDAVALEFHENHRWERWTYKSLDQRANGLAGHLLHQGVVPEQAVGLYVKRGPEMLLGFLACFKIGAVATPLDPAHPQDRIAYMAENVGARLVITTSDLAEALKDLPVQILTVDDRKTGQAVTRPVDPGNTAYVMFTSGSTGRPKGVAVNHEAMANRFLWARETYPMTGMCRFLQTASYGFDIALWEMFAPLIQGAGLVLLPHHAQGDVPAMVDAVQNRNITDIHFVPSLMEAFLRDPGFANLTSLERVYCGGEALAAGTLQRFRAGSRAAIHHFYGPTEAAINATAWDSSLDAGTPVTIGRPISNAEVYILDRNGNPTPQGVPGELHIGGAGLAFGYTNASVQTAAAFVPHPFSSRPGSRLYRTGDLALWNEKGWLKFMGRIDHQLKIRGFRVETAEIEALLRDREAVNDAVALVEDQELLAFAAGTDDPAELKRYLAGKLPAYMIPRHVVVLDRLPINANGKLDRRTLLANKAQEEAVVFKAPQTRVQRELARIWEDVLKAGPVGLAHHFFQMGGHSLLSTQVASRIRETFGVSLPLRELFKHPILGDLAAVVAQAEGPGSDGPPPLKSYGLKGPVALSFAQRRLWFIDQYEGPNPMYNIAFAVRFRVEVSVAALKRALSELVNRHDVLRTTFQEQSGEPVQIIGPPRGMELPVVDLKGDEAGLKAMAREDAATPFDLAKGPLFRASLVCLGDQDYTLLLNTHHIVSDGWSTGVMTRELNTLYQAFLSDPEGPSPLEPLPIQYADYSHWCNTWLKGAYLDEQLTWWRENLEGAPTVLELPLDRPRPQYQTTAGAQYRFQATPQLTQALQGLGQQADATLFMTLQAVFSLLLSRYSGQNDICLGASVANRNHQGVEGLIGFFVNTLVLRNQIQPQEPFLAFLERVRTRTLDAFDHGDAPFEKVVDVLQPERSLNHSPLFQVMFELQNAPTAGEGEAMAAPFESLETAGSTALFDLTLNMLETRDGLIGVIEYNTDLFNQSTVAQIAGHFLNLLKAVTAEPQRPVGRLELLSQAQRRMVLTEWNQNQTPFPLEICFHRHFEVVAAEHACSAAVSMLTDNGPVNLTYENLNRRANGLARALLDLGVGSETPVALIGRRNLDFATAILAIFKTGGVYLPLSPDLPETRMAAILKESGTAVALISNQVAPPLAVEGVRTVALEPLLDLEGAHPNLDVPTHPHQLAYVIYTSGSTGTPKGAMVTHRGMLNHLYAKIRDLKLIEDDVVAQNASQSFDISVWQFLAAWLVGGRTHVIPDAVAHNPPELLRETHEEGVTILETVPSLLAIALEETGEDRPSLERLRWMIPTGEALPPAVAGRWLDLCPHAPLLNAYGPTECSDDVSHHVVDQAPKPEVVNMPIGRPVANLRLYIVDSNMEPAPPGVSGELLVGGVGVGRGYLQNPARTAQTFIPDPFANADMRDECAGRLYRTGDLCRADQDGVVIFLGRKDHQVKIRGFRIELGEIETQLTRQPGVREAMVLVREDRPGQKGLAAFITGPEDRPAEVARLTDALGKTLPQYMVPGRMVIMDRFPLTPNGKVDRKALATMALPDQIEPDHQEHGNEVERMLGVIWASVLQTDQVGAHGNFFDLGGHSLLAVKLLTRVKNAFNITLQLRDLFQNPTPAAFAQRIQNTSNAEPYPPMETGAEEGALSFAQERLWFLDRLEGPSATYNIPIALRLKGTLNEDALLKAVATLLGRHKIFAASFHDVEGAPVQKYDGPQGAPERVDLSHLDGDAATEALTQLAEQVAQEPFDLTQAPLARFTLVRLTDHERVLLASLHHIITDGWSVDLMIREIVRGYRAFAAGEQPQWGAQAIQYADYAHWQRQWLAGQRLESMLGWWKAQLAGLPQLHQLPLDHSRPVVQTFRGNNYHFNVPAEVAGNLSQLARTAGATLFMVLEAAFAHLISRYSGQTDVAVGTPVANRNRGETHEVMGLFANTLTLRNDLTGDPSFLELAARVRRMVLDAHEHQDVPFEKVVDAVQPVRNLSHSPLFQIMFILQNGGGDGTRSLPGLVVEPLSTGRHTTARFELTLTILEGGDGFRCTFEYNTDLFLPQTMARMADHFKRLLAAVVQQPETPLSHCSILDDTERDGQLRQWNQTRDGQTVEPVHQSLEARAGENPQAFAVCMAGEKVGGLSYEALNAAANRVAHGLTALGAGPGVAVALCMERSVDMLVGMLGILKSGAAYVPMDPAYPAARLDHMLTDSEAPILLSQAFLADRFPAVKTVVLDQFSQEPEHNLERVTDPRQLAYIIYTSGSTGNPKGVEVSHGALSNFLASMGSRPGLSANDTLMAVTTISFDIAGLELYLPLVKGAGLVIAREDHVLDGVLLAHYLEGHDVTVMQATPAGWRLLLESGWSGKSDLRMFCGGEAMPRDLVNQLRGKGAALWNLYGPTETTIWSSVCDAWEDEGHGPVSIGLPIRNTQTYVLDGNLEPAPAGVSGRLYIGGDGLARGYRNLPGMTAEKFIPDPHGDRTARLYDTGDLARRRADGGLEFMGRADAQVKLRGFRIELGEIESVLNQQPKVEEAVAVIRRDNHDHRLVAYLRTSDEDEDLIPRLKAALADRLPDYMTPGAFVVMDQFPLTPNGKVNRRALPAPKADQDRKYRAARNNREQELTLIFERLLGVSPIGLDDNFFELGGHSLLAVRLAALLEREQGLVVSLAQIFRNPTVVQLAALDLAESESPLVCFNNNAERHLFLVHPVGGTVHCYQELANELGKDRSVWGLQSPAIYGDFHLETMEAVADSYIKAMRSVQAEGPYHLAGWSSGGVFALEMARQLKKTGFQVGSLLLMDTDRPEQFDSIPDDVELLVNLVQGMLQEDFVWNLDQLRSMDESQRLAHIYEVAGGGALFGSEVDLARLKRFWNTFRYNARLDLNYQPGLFDGDMLYIKAKERSPLEEADPAETWKRRISGTMTLLEIEGAHHDLIERRQAKEIAQWWRRSMDEA